VKAFDFLQPQQVLIEIGHRSVTALDGERNFEMAIDRLPNGKLTDASKERLTAGLREFLKTKNWQPRRRALCAINARGVSLRPMTVPAAPKQELNQLLLLQIEREFPLSPDELAWGYCEALNGSPTQNRALAGQELIVAAVKREVIEEYTAPLSACGLIPIFTLGALARASLCPLSPGAYALLDIGQTQSELISFQNGTPRAIRILPWGA